MKHTLLFTCLVLTWMIFSGCPYESNVPIDQPNQAIDSLLLGNWEDRGDYNQPYTISQLNHYTYKIVHQKNNGIADTYYAYTNKVADRTFLNLWQEDTLQQRKYLLYSIENKHEGIITLKEVSEKTKVHFSSSTDLKKYLEAHMNDSDFYNKNETIFINREQIFELNKKQKINEIELSQARKANGDLLMLWIGWGKFVKTMIIVFIVIILLLLLAFYYYFKKRQSEKLLSNEKINTLLKNQELMSMSAMLEGEEKERKRIALDLHDRLGSMLSTIKLHFIAVEEQLDKLKIPNNEQFNTATLLLDEACEEVRKIANNLVAGELMTFGLTTALNQLKRTIEDTKTLKIHLHIFGLSKRLESNIEIHVYRIIQEAMNNILKHSKAKVATIQLNLHNDVLNVMIEDDGIGFNTEISNNNAGMGLKNIDARAKSLNAKFDIDSGKGKGCTIIIDIPVKSEL